MAHDTICGIPYTQQDTTGRTYVPGQVVVTVTPGRHRPLEVRRHPAGGHAGSRPLDERHRHRAPVSRAIAARSVFHRAHVPILNVKYDRTAAAPTGTGRTRKGRSTRNGTDVAPGFRLCPQPAKTILDTGSDAGNFLGVGGLREGQEVVLVSEMEAGWYRYISEWRLPRGRDDPSALRVHRRSRTRASATCTTTTPIGGSTSTCERAGNNVVKEFNDPPLPGMGTAKWHTKSLRDPASASTEAQAQVARREQRHRRGLRHHPRARTTASRRDARLAIRARGRLATPLPPGRDRRWVAAIGPPYAASIGAWVNGEPINGTRTSSSGTPRISPTTSTRRRRAPRTCRRPDPEARALVTDVKRRRRDSNPRHRYYTHVTP